MRTSAHIFSRDEWDLARWFVILSPLIGIVLGLLALFAFAR